MHRAPRRPRRRISLLALLLGVATLLVVGSPQVSEAAATVPFTPKFSANASGAMITIPRRRLPRRLRSGSRSVRRPGVTSGDVVAGGEVAVGPKANRVGPA
ncbi:hypothetical protein [Nocardioides panacihumi]|uniref:hypothetical protein n=1 Tax=Nocardioides panacihumi TaxID=400774 RepID=UPI0031DC6B0D